MVITGPNTGGKTVTLKTVGLLIIMAQSAIHIPCEEAVISIFENIFADIGDGQSIENSLSTFSSHIKNIVDILKKVNNKSLVLLDEIGSGTDPQEGKGIAIAVLELLFKKGATILTTTHLSEIKEYAAKTKGFENASMDFDLNSLKPLYKLRIGIGGDSNAFIIAFKLGLDKEILNKAHEITYGNALDIDKLTAAREQNAGIKQDLEAKYMLCEEDNNEDFNAVSQDYSYKRDLLRTQEIEVSIKNFNMQTEENFEIGDSVFITTLQKTGIVCEKKNAKGEVIVQVMGKRINVNSKSIKPHI